MDDLDRLRARLVRLGDPPDPVNGQARFLLNPRSPDPLIAMQREIEETQLPRALTFFGDGEDVLVLHVKAGRVVAVAAAPHDQISSMDILGLPLSGYDASQKDTFCRILSAFSKNAIALSVQSSMTSPDISPAVTGICPIECFSNSALIERQTAAAKLRPNMQQFFDLCAGFATAWIWVQGAEICNRHGDPSRISKLYDLAQKEISGRATPASGATTPANADLCVIICGAGNDAEAILSCRSADSLAFMSFAASSIADVLAAWRAVTVSDET